MSDEEAEASGDEAPPKRVLRIVDLLSEVPNGDTEAATQLLLNERELTSLESLESMRNLKKLELRGNHLTELGFVEMNHGLCWLNAAKNRLSRIKQLGNLSSLAVLDISDNRLTRLEGLSGLSGLKTLIAARNRITHVKGLTPKKNPALEILVLSHNSITECSLGGYTSLRKLSLANNKLHAFPELERLPALAELRLNGNQLVSIAACVGSLPKLSILDVGNNLITALQGLEPLRGLLWVKSLSIMGNPIASDMESPGLQALLASLSKLEIVNNRRQSGKPQKRRNRHLKDGARAQDSSAAVPVAVHGRAFEGKRAVFQDSDEEGASPSGAHATGSNGGARSEGRGVRGMPSGGPGRSGASAIARGRGSGRGAGPDTSPGGKRWEDGGGKARKLKKRSRNVAADSGGVGAAEPGRALAASAGADAEGGEPKKKKKKVKKKASGAPAPSATAHAPSVAAAEERPKKKRRRRPSPETAGAPASAPAGAGRGARRKKPRRG